MTSWGRFPIRQDPECHSDIFHFRCDGVSPEGVAVDTVKVVFLFHGLRDFNPIFVGPF